MTQGCFKVNPKQEHLQETILHNTSEVITNSFFDGQNALCLFKTIRNTAPAGYVECSWHDVSQGRAVFSTLITLSLFPKTSHLTK